MLHSVGDWVEAQTLMPFMRTLLQKQRKNVIMRRITYLWCDLFWYFYVWTCFQFIVYRSNQQFQLVGVRISHFRKSAILCLEDSPPLLWLGVVVVKCGIKAGWPRYCDTIWMSHRGFDLIFREQVTCATVDVHLTSIYRAFVSILLDFQHRDEAIKR